MDIVGSDCEMGIENARWIDESKDEESSQGEWRAISISIHPLLTLSRALTEFHILTLYYHWPLTAVYLQ